MQYSTRIECLEDKSLLNAMELVETEDMISFSAGFPSSETYPIEEIKDCFIEVLEQAGESALSYCSTSGYRMLREIIGQRMSDKFDIHYELNEIIITSGSQQGLDMSGMLFINKGDVVLFETPSYLGAVNALRAHEAKLVAVPTDSDGIEINALRENLEKYGDRIKLIYVIPDFQNPTGRSWSLERREEFIELLSGYEIPVLEDAAYSELSFETEPMKPLASFDRKGQVIYIGTFSKTFCPGLRVAWLACRSEMMEKYLVLKNAADLSSPAICQMQMAHYLSRYDLDVHIAKVTALYKHRRDLMAQMILKEFPETVHFVLPKGGLFIWLTLPEGKDARKLLERSFKEGVAFVPGSAFYPSGAKNNELRLNFSNLSDGDMIRGLLILGRITKEYLQD